MTQLSLFKGAAAKTGRSVKISTELSGFATQFRHWRSGKLMVAADYGHRVWPIGKKKRH